MSAPGAQAPQALIEGRERFLGFVRSKVGDPELAEDILQDSFVKAVRGAPDLRDGDRLEAWFYSILRNSISDLYRKLHREPLHIDIEFAEDLPEDPQDFVVVCECFRAILPTLPPQYAELIEQIDLGGVTPSQVAVGAGINVNNLKVRHHRARKALRERLEQTCRICAEHHCLDCSCQPE